MENHFTRTCPIPINEYPTVQLAHGGGGSLMNHLIKRMFMESFANQTLHEQHDSAVFNVTGNRLAYTTDSYVVSPLFFPGGNIGHLAIHGTVNDLSMSGAKPLYLSAGFIIEEGFPMEKLWQIVQTMQAAAVESGVQIVTGDTKVVDKGKGDGVFINTSGIGVVSHNYRIHADQIQPDDAIIVNGDLGRHGMAIMAQRHDLGFETEIKSDTASLVSLVDKLIQSGIGIHCMRDLTRGGLSSALNELAESSGMDFTLEENTIPINKSVRSFSEVIGIDPLYSANEGRMVLFVNRKDAEKAIELMKSDVAGKDACMIGTVNEKRNGCVMIRNTFGSLRMLPMNSGEQLPRIC